MRNIPQSRTNNTVWMKTKSHIKNSRHFSLSYWSDLRKLWRQVPALLLLFCQRKLNKTGKATSDIAKLFTRVNHANVGFDKILTETNIS